MGGGQQQWSGTELCVVRDDNPAAAKNGREGERVCVHGQSGNLGRQEIPAKNTVTAGARGLNQARQKGPSYCGTLLAPSGTSHLPYQPTPPPPPKPTGPGGHVKRKAWGALGPIYRPPTTAHHCTWACWAYWGDRVSHTWCRWWHYANMVATRTLSHLGLARRS